jgi:hypothetical protein
MKGISLTLTIVIVAIVLLVTALVIMTVFSGQIARIMTLLGIWSDEAVAQGICKTRCSAWCSDNPGKDGPASWTEVGDEVVISDTVKKSCSTVMVNQPCKCTLATGG